MRILFDQISEKLLHYTDVIETEPAPPKRAAVAMILHQKDDLVEILFIQRAADDRDPWSGHIAFPGGKLEEGELEYQAACRETYEEIGIDLNRAYYLGRLSDIIGSNLPVRVSCCLFGIDKLQFSPILNEEVSDLFWISLNELKDSSRHIKSTVAFDEKKLEVPAIRLSVNNKPVLWGITYRLVMQFMKLLDNNGLLGENSYNKLPKVIEINEEEN